MTQKELLKLPHAATFIDNMTKFSQAPALVQGFSTQGKLDWLCYTCQPPFSLGELYGHYLFRYGEPT